MASNNTDWDFGETRYENDETTIAEVHDGRTVTGGDIVRLGETKDNDVFTIADDGFSGGAVNADIYGVVVNLPKKRNGNAGTAGGGSRVEILIRGITRIRNTPDAAIAAGARVAHSGGRLKTAASSGTSKAFAVNIGGALASGDTGLFYVDTMAGIIGGTT